MPSRHLASAQEVCSTLSLGPAEGPYSPRCRLREWPGVQVVTLQLGGAGAVAVSPLARPSVLTVREGPSRSSVDVDGGGAVPLAAGAAQILAAGAGFRYAWTGPHQATLACVDPAVLRRAAAGSGIGDPHRPHVDSAHRPRDPICDHLVRVLAEEAELEPHPAQPLLVEAVADALAYRLLCGRGAAPRRAAGALGGRAFAAVQAYIEAHLGERIALADLALVAGMSRFHFARRFRLRTGESPMGYLLRLRIERGKSMLADDGARVADVATSLGFADQSHFSRVFRRLVGVAPGGFGRARSGA